MADYRDHYEEIRAAGADVAAVSADSPEKSETLRRDLRLPFPILCDTERRVIQDWDIYNARERGGIAKPAVFLIGRGRAVLYSHLDEMVKRIPPLEIVRILRSVSHREPAKGEQKVPAAQKSYIPGPGDFLRAIRAQFRR